MHCMAVLYKPVKHNKSGFINLISGNINTLFNSMHEVFVHHKYLKRCGGYIKYNGGSINALNKDMKIQLYPLQVMWKAVERTLGPGFSRDKCEVILIGTPLTHQRFLRRNRGTYGPAIQAGKETFPGHPTPIPQLYCCGDSTFPGIGVPAVAASGAIVANSLVSVSQHSELLDAVGI